MTAPLTDEELERFAVLAANAPSTRVTVNSIALQSIVTELRAARRRLAELELSDEDRGALEWVRTKIEVQPTRSREGFGHLHGQGLALRALALLDRLLRTDRKEGR